MIYIRSTIFNICFYLALAITCAVTSFLGLFSQKLVIKIWNYGTIPFCVWMLKVIAGIEIEIRGKQYIRQEGVVYACKHQSALETYTLSKYIKKAVMILKKELTYIPIFGWAQAVYGMIAVDRGNGGAAMKKMLKDAQKRIDNGRPIVIFPEGTRTKPGTKTVYKPGLYFIVQNLKTPVIPVAVNTGLFWEKKSFLRHPGKVIYEFMEPMPEDLDKQEFMTELERRIETKCGELNEESANKYPHAAKVLKRNKGK